MVIVFEGHDGCGKTTLINLLKKDLELLNKNIITMKCPSDEENEKRQLIDDSDSLQKSFDFYYECCVNSSSKIAKYRNIVDYILLDRYYFSTMVSHEARGLYVNRTLFDHLEKVDLKIEIKTDEKIRRERLIRKSDIRPHDLKTLDNELIRKADELYSMLGFIPIYNNNNVEQTLMEITKNIINHVGKL